MKNIYSPVIVLMFLFSVQVWGQNRIYPPNLRSPENGQTGQYPDVILDWDAVSGQTTNITYEAQLATSADFSDAISFPRTALTAMFLNDLMFDKVYYWRVKAYDSDEPSDWSEAWSFKIVSTVSVISPRIGHLEYANPLIKWNAISGLLKYEMQIDSVSNWKIEDVETTNDIQGTFTLDDTHSWVVGEGGLIKFYDGTSWTDQDGSTTENLNAVFFMAPENGYAVGDNGTVLFFDGSTWTSIDAGTTDDLNSVFFVDADNGWAVGKSGIVLNYTSGTWTQSAPQSEDLFGVYALSTTNVWACGAGKIVLHFDGTEWTSEVVGVADHYALWFTNAENGWLVGKSGKIDYFNGNEWTSQKSGTSKDLYSVSFNASGGYAVGKSGSVVRFLGNWQQAASLSAQNLNAVWLIDNAGTMAGNSGTLIVKNAEGFNSPFSHILGIPFDSASFQLVDLPFGSTIYYRMRALHSQDTSVWSATRSLVTRTSVTLLNPKNNLTDTDLGQLFSWKVYNGASQYFIEISDNENFDNAFIFTSDSTSINLATFYFDTKWWWHVRAAHQFDISDWSDIWTFTTTNTVNLETPENNAEDVTFCPLYKWQEITGVSSYQIWIDTTDNFLSPNKTTVKTPFFQCNSPLKRKTQYYWKVRSISTLDSSGFSPTWSFTTEGYTGIEDHFGDNSIEVYPNPNNGRFTLRVYSTAGETYQITILDLTGKQIYQKDMATKPGDNEIKFNLGDVKGGMYLLHIKKGNDEVLKKLFLN